MNRMRVYISGKIGEAVISEATRQKFAKAEEMLKAKGYEVFNPVDERWQRVLKGEYEGDSYVRSPWLAGTFPDFYTYCLLRDQMVLSTKDAVYFLDDFRSSPEANSEYYFAKAAGKKMMFQQHLHAVTRLSEIYQELVAKGMPPVQREEGEDDNDLLLKYIERNISEVWLHL